MSALPSPNPRRLLAALILGAVLLAGGCARRPAWPPPAGEAAAHVTVVASRYHSLLAVPAPGGGVEEWAFGERVWFCDAKDERAERAQERAALAGAALRALFWPNGGVIERTRAERPFNARNPGEPVRAWTIPVSQDGLARMRAWLESSIGSPQPVLEDGAQIYYPSRRRYHALHTCNHYVAEALYAAGVPVRPGFCLVPPGLWWQLNGLEVPVTAGS